MSSQVRISHPELLLLSDWKAPGKTDQSSGRIISWCGDNLETPTLISCIAGFDTIRSFNSISIEKHQEYPQFFPNTFRIDISNDGIVWEPIIHESDFQAGLNMVANWNFPLISARYIKFLFLSDKMTEKNDYFSAFGPFRVMISGIVSLNVTSELDRLWVKANLIDERSEYGWSSALKSDKQEEFIDVDLGSINCVNELRLLSKNDTETFFPEIFQVSFSEDNIAWHHMLEENGFLAEPATWYRWRFVPTNIRYLRIIIKEGARTREGKYISQIIEIELFAAAELISKSPRVASEPTPYASVLRPGLVRLAMDGEEKEGLAVQGGDRRLKDATSERKGIIELATDGENREGAVVQGNDRRLKYATEDMPGIIRLARNGEVRSGHALQSSDSRIKKATETSAGLVELAANGENKPEVVVQSNDQRLRRATVKNYGIIRLAENKSVLPNEVVQGNDQRLQNATTENPGIMRFAHSGETNAEAAVQANDRRLLNATTENKGIVELALDGERKEGVVVQGSDRRLKKATVSESGIVRLASHNSNEKERVVQASDPRLSDKREPLLHTHEYTPLNHDFDSHSGRLKIKDKTGSFYKTLTEPPKDHAPITAINTGGGAGVVGRGEFDGIIGTGKSAGTIGYGLSGGTGVVGASRRGSGGRFFSEKGFALVAGGEWEERDLKNSTLALLIRGQSRFTDSINSGGEERGFPAAIGVYFPVENSDVISNGDILVASKKEGVLCKSTGYGVTTFIGVAIDKSPLIINNPEILAPNNPNGFEDKSEPLPVEFQLVAISGVVKIRAVATTHPISPGDLLVTSNQPGTAQKFKGGNIKPGMFLARSLDRLSRGEGMVRVLLLSM